MKRRLALIIATILLAQNVHADTDYPLVAGYIGNKRFITVEVQERAGVYYVDQSFFEKLRLPITEPKPLEFLKNYGDYEFNKYTQTLRFFPSRPEWFLAQQKAKVANPAESIEQKSWDWKSVDYQATHTISSTGKPVSSLFAVSTGRVFGLDLDASFNTLDNRVGGLLQWHNEANPYLRDVQVGTLPLYNIDRGVSVSNEPITRFTTSNEFGKQTIYLSQYPLGSRVDVIRRGAVIATYTVDRLPFPIVLDMIYGSNEFTLRVLQPDGKNIEQYIKRDVDSYMVKRGLLEYTGAYGVDKDYKEKYRARVGYGLTDWATLQIDATDVPHTSTFGAYLRVNDDLIIKPKVYDNGFGGELYYTKDWLTFQGQATEKSDLHERRGVVAIGVDYQPSLSASEVEYNGHTTTTTTFRLAKALSTPVANLHLSPFGEYQKYDNTITKAVGGTAIAMFSKAIRFQTEYRYQDDTSQKLDLALIKEMSYKGVSIGELKGFANFWQAPGQKMDIHAVGVETRLYNWQYASLSANYQHTFDGKGSDSATFSISGSLTRAGACKTAQRSYATLDIRTHIKDSDEAINAIVYVNSVQHKVPKNGHLVIPDLVPYIKYNVSTEPGIDVEPVQYDFEITPARGELAIVDVPFYQMIDLEGQAPAPGVVCKLVKDGKVVKTQRAGSDANYLFSIRSEDKARYTVEFDVQPVVKIKDEIKPIIPQIVEKPVVMEAMPEPVKADKPASTEKSIKSEHEVVITEEQEPSTVRPRNCLKGVFRKITKASVEKIAKKIIEMKPQRVVIYACGTSKADSIRLARKAEKMIEKIPGTYVNAVDFGTPNQCK